MAKPARARKATKRIHAKAASATVPETRDTEAGKVVILRPRLQARTVDSLDRWNARSGQWGELSAATLANTLRKAERGEIEDWADLCEFMVGTDPLVQSNFVTRRDRVLQADWIVAPNKNGDRELARRAARFCRKLFDRIENQYDGLRHLMGALSPGFSFVECVWEYDSRDDVTYVSKFIPQHGHRFRYGVQWDPRFYDRGRKPGADGYGEHLKPYSWLVHHHFEQPGTPGVAGVMRSCALPWLFRRWASKWEMGNLEVNGRPLVYAKVPRDTPRNVRVQIQEDLERLSADHAGVMEQGVDLVVEASAQAAAGYNAYRTFADGMAKEIDRAWHGISDATEPGTHGSQSAVETRTGLAMDPRMVSDGIELGETITRQLFRAFIALNRHHFFGLEPGIVPLPEHRFRTAADEAEVDAEDLRQERRDAGEQAQPAEQPMDREQASAVLEIVKEATAGGITREAGIALARSIAPQLTEKRAAEMFGGAPSAVAQSKSPLARALRGELV